MKNLKTFDPELEQLIQQEKNRQSDKIRLIASENYVSPAVLEATGSILTNKYSEGYPGRRYYEGQQNVDLIEEIAIARAKEVFGAEHVNVQPYSGSPANLAVYLAFLKPGDTILGLALAHGGHLTHGAKVSISGQYFNVIPYELDRKSGLLNYDEIEKLALQHKPKIIVAGHSAYPRILDFARFREIADKVGAILFVDMAHFAGLVAGGAHPSPIPYADVVTTTTHKTLRGPRGAMILCREAHAQKIDKAIFPGLQGGPHNHTTAAIAVAMKEALSPSFSNYAKQIVDNCRRLSKQLIEKEYQLITNGTDNHLILIDLTNKKITGKTAAKALDQAGLVLNYNAVPYDQRKPFDPSGVRLGTAAVTSRGFGEAEMDKIAHWMDLAIKNSGEPEHLNLIKEEVRTLCKAYPAPGISP